jgi:prepilin peptidase CpaA
MEAATCLDLAVSTGAVSLACWAGWLDWRSRRIPNWLTIPGLVLGLAANALGLGWPGAKAALEGAGIAFGVLLPFVMARGLGAGDWKLMGALGAFLGPPRTVVVLLGTVFIAGIMAVVELVRKRRVKETLINLWILIVAYSTFRIRSAEGLTLDNPVLLKVPFGTAAAFSTVLFFGTVTVFRVF